MQLSTSGRAHFATVCYSVELSLTTNTLNVAISSKQTHKLRLSYCFNAATICTAIDLLNSGAGNSLVSSTLCPPQTTNCIKREKMPHFCTATQEPLYMEVSILLNIRLRDICVRVWSEIFHKLAVKMLLGTIFVDRFLRKLFLAKHEVVPWQFHLVAILPSTQCDQKFSIGTSHVTAPLGELSSDEMVSSNPIRIAGQTILKPHCKHCVLVTNSATRNNIVESRVFEGTSQMTFAAHSMIDTLPLQPFHILEADFSAKAMHLPKHMSVAKAQDLFRHSRLSSPLLLITL